MLNKIIQRQPLSSVQWSGLASFILIMLLTISTWLTLRHEYENYMSEILRMESRRIHDLIRSEYTDHVNALERLARRQEFNGDVTQAAWEADARSYIETFSGIGSIHLADVSGAMRWSVSAKTGSEVAAALQQDEHYSLLLQHAAATGRLQAASGFESFQDGKTIVVARPVFHKAHLHGYIIGVVRLAQLIEYVTGQTLSDGFSVIVTRDDQIIYRNTAANAVVFTEPVSSRMLELADGRWQIDIAPTPAAGTASSLSHWVHALVLLAGIITAVLTLTAFWLWGLNRQRHADLLVKDRNLQQENEFSRATINTLPGTFFVIDNQGRILRHNDNVVKITGYSEAEIQRMSAADFFFEADRPLVTEHIKLSFTRGHATMEVKVRTRNGEAIPYYLQVQRVVLDGQPCLVGTGTDMAEFRSTQAELLRSEAHLKEAQRIASMGHWSLDIVSGQLQWSDEIYRIFGYETGAIEPSYSRFFACVHPDDIERVKASEQHAMAQNLPHSIDHRIVRPDGMVRWVHEEAQVVRDSAGRPVRLTGTVQDITRRMQSEQAVHTSEARLRTILDTAVDGIITIDSHGFIESINPAAQALFGYSADELVGRNVSVLMPEPDRSAHDGYLAQYERTGQSKIVGIGRELLAQRKDGNVFPIELAVSEMDIEGRHMFAGFVRDISERKEFEQRLMLARDQAEQANRAKTEFLSNMSHELRTPMNAILGFAQLLQTAEPPLSDPQRDDVNEILHAGQHLLELINELLDMARIEAGRMDISLEAVQLSQVMSECLPMIEPMLLQYGVSYLGHDTSELDCAVIADRVRLRQVVLNLLSNAIKYNRRGGTVKVNWRREADEFVRIEVTDTGMGIAPEKQAELFASFSRLGAESLAIEGTGIGLAITRRLVDLMHGQVGLESRPGDGSTFWVELPAVAVETGIQHARKVAGKSASGGTPVRSDRGVLYIEDNPTNLRFMMHLLDRRTDIRLMTAADPHTGLAMAATEQPDLILLDIQLPDMDGYEVFRRLQADTAMRAIPVIAVSANAMPEHRQRALDMGFYDYLTKPLDIVYFMDVLEAVLKPVRQAG